MKVFNRTSLPEQIKYNGAIYTRYQPEVYSHNIITTALEARAKGLKVIQVNVLQSILKGRKDFHGQNYKPTKWIFTTSNN